MAPRAGVEVVGDDLVASASRGSVFERVHVDVPAGGIGVVHGPGGSGRSTLLLALCGRFRLTSGRLHVGGHDASAESAAIRELSAVARIRPGIEPDEGLRVRDVRRQHVLAGAGTVTERAIDAGLEVVAVDPSPDAPLGDLPPIEALLLLVALAFADRRSLIVVDDVDHGLVPAERRRAWAALDEVAAAGPTVLASALEPPEGIEHVPIALPHPTQRWAASPDA